MSRSWWLALVGVSAVVLVVQLPGDHATAWHFFELGVDLLVDSGPDGDGAGLALYRDHPELQFGPVSIVAAIPFVVVGDLFGTGNGEVAVMVAASVLGLVVVRWLLDLLDVVAPRFVTSGVAVRFATGVLVVVTWGDVAVRTAHIDDALALAAIVYGLRAVAQGRAEVATMALALAAAAKPWAIVFVPVAAVAPGSRPWVRPLFAGGFALVTWLPFILAEPATLDTSDFAIENDPTSVLRALGVDAATTPEWVRPVQLIGGLAIVGLLVFARRWPASLLAGVAWRLLVDPGAHRYYTIGFVLGALIVELRAHPERVPWITAVAAVVLETTALPDAPSVLAQASRLAVVVGGLVVAARSTPVDRVSLAPS